MEVPVAFKKLGEARYFLNLTTDHIRSHSLFQPPRDVKTPRAPYLATLWSSSPSEGEKQQGNISLLITNINLPTRYAYSLKPNPWEWLTSKEKAEAMAEKVARWRDDYGIDGIDLDLEEGAGSKKAAGPNMVHFTRRLKSLQPDLLVSQPTYGYPQVQAEIDVINASWQPGGASNGLADTIGLMVYEGAQALLYIKNYAAGSEQWQGFPIKVADSLSLSRCLSVSFSLSLYSSLSIPQVDVPKDKILLGLKGSSSSRDIMKLARESVKQNLLGVMVWYCSVQNGLKYAATWDCTGRDDSMAGFVEAMDYLNNN